jgi:UDP-N-acetylmuramoyl-L-alanyl-D-glutamate--2,6-diaminopimelate ligase
VFAAAIPGLKNLVGRIADRFFNWPSSQLRITGITGTNGKTTCAYLLAQCLERLGSQAAYMGTIGWGRVASLAAPTLTTPDAVTLHRELAQLRAAGIREVAMEVSSQALDQDRVAGVRFHCAAFTNLTRDHLDYHRTMAAYGAAKARLFDAPDLQHIVLNVGDSFGREFAQNYGGRVPLTAVWIGAGDSGWLAERALHAARVALDARGVSLQIDGSFGEAGVATRLLGRFNAENALVVLACLLSLGASLEEAARVLAECVPPPGRMEVVESAAGGKPMAVVDYAHTPDALAKALGALREHCQGDLWCVFGCGGDRDPGKRVLMGAIADDLADQIIVTDDNPRSEDPQVITRAIVAGIKAHGVRVIHDRGEAIGRALKQARAEDIVLIAGKGHEDYQIYGATRRSFSDRREAQRHLGVAA